MKKNFLLIILWLLVFIFPLVTSSKNLSFVEKNGTNQIKIQKISGPFQFYWKEFINPLKTPSDSLETNSIQTYIPNYWSEYQKDGIQLPGLGFGSYQLKIVLPRGYKQPIGISIPSIDVAYKFFINGELMAGCGKIGQSPDEELPEYMPVLVRYQPLTDTLNLVFHVSNFHHRRGGIWKEITIGPFNEMNLAKNKDDLIDLFSLGILFSFGIFFLIFSFYYRSEKSIPFLSIAFLLIFIRGICTNQYPIKLMIPISWEWMIKIEYFGIFGAIMAGTWGFFMYPIRWNRTILNVLTIGLVPIFGIIVFMDVPQFAYTIYLFYIYLILCVSLLITQMLVLIKTKERLSILYLLGITSLIIAAINDTLVANSYDIIFGNYVLPRVFIIFVLILSLEFFRRYAEIYKKEKSTSNELSKLNIILEKKVEERTVQLNEKNQIIEEQNEFLKQDIHLKNKILSIIGHDIQSPLSSIVMGFDLITENEFTKEERDLYMNNIKLSANSLLQLVENLLSWGLSQNKQLKVIAKYNNLTELVDRVIEQTKSISEHKEISIIKDVPLELKGWFDDNSVLIVLRNLLSNALKFTPKGGDITIRAIKEPSHISVEISDSGIGMDALKLEQINKGSDIISNEGTDNEKGTGLGLILCRELISLNKGNLSVESELGKGSRFIFSLPLEQPL